MSQREGDNKDFFLQPFGSVSKFPDTLLELVKRQL